MRPKIVIVVLLTGIAGIVTILFLKHETTPPQPTLTPPEIASQPTAPAVPPVSSMTSNAAPTQPVVTFAQPPVVTISHPAVDTNAMTEENETSVQAEIDKLTELQANDDADSLHAILADLTNSDKEIRAAAVESTIQFGSRDAIPVLKNLAAHTEDQDEKKDLLDAADFLALPKLGEPDQSDGQPQMQNSAPPQDASPQP